MKLGGAQKQREGATMEEARLKRALDEARENFVREARAATNITLSRKGLRPKAFLGGYSRLHRYIANNPDSPVAVAHAKYEEAFDAYKTYLKENKSQEDAGVDIATERARVIQEARKSSFQARFEELFKKHPVAALTLAIAIYGPIVLTFSYVVGPAVAALLIPIGIGARLITKYGTVRKDIRSLAKKGVNPDEIGRKAANWEYGMNWFWIFFTFVLGGMARAGGLEEAIEHGVGVNADILHQKTGAVIGIHDMLGISEAEAAPRVPQTGPEGVITPEEQALIDKTLDPYERIADQYDAKIKAFENQREDFIRRVMATGRPRREAEFYFDANLDMLKDAARAYRNLVDSSRAQLEHVARWPYKPDVPDALVSEARLRSQSLSQFAGELENQYRQFAGTIERGRLPVYVESSLQNQKGGAVPVSHEPAAENPDTNIGDGAVEVPAAGREAIAALWEIARPAFEGYNKVTNMIALLDSVEPEFGTPAHTEWYNLRNRLVDVQTAYRDMLHGYARLQSVLGNLSVKNPSLSSDELISLIQDDQDNARGLKTLASLEDGAESRANELIDRARAKYNLPEPSATPRGSVALPTEGPEVQDQGEVVEVAYEDLSQIKSPFDYQEYMGRKGRAALRILFSQLDRYTGRADVASINYRARLLSAIEDVNRIIEEGNKDILDDQKYLDAETGPRELQRLARTNSSIIDAIVRGVMPRGSRPTIA